MTGLPNAAREAVELWFRDNFVQRGELGAAVSIWRQGVEVLSLAQGFTSRERTTPWSAETLVPIWSSTKGPAAVACLMALHEAGLPLEAPVVEVWPEFFLGGKDQLTFAQLLSHCGGLCALSEKVPIFDYMAVIKALEKQTPLWPAGTTQAYHARTFGFLLDEIVRRITGADTLGHYFDELFGRPMGLDFWIGLPEAEHGRVARIYPGKMNISTADQAFLKAYHVAGSVTQRTFASPVGLGAVQDFNQPHTWTQGYASMGGVASASGLAKFYALLAHCGQGGEVIPEWILQALSTPLSQAEDAVLCVPAAFSAGMMKDPVDRETGAKIRRMFGPSLAAFGHPGAGGSLAFSDPASGIGFAYVMNQMEVGVLPSERATGLVEALFSHL
ncbi:MAG: CubicO group peptidase beta-lactamase class family [Verrucomicrobiaceae bacterium]|nr:CubicO group peptidase beta-lactamase class family [Verrucomicrobiaceae bacterium]